MRAPYEANLAECLAVTQGTLYRRGNFNGTGDQLLLDALMDVQNAEIAFPPGFRWGTSLLAGQVITREWLMDMTATTDSFATVTEMTGETIKTILEDVCDNLFNPDPCHQQGSDMVRVGGLQYSCTPLASMGKRIDDLRLNGKPIEASKKYKVARWAPAAEEARTAPSNKLGKWSNSGSSPARARSGHAMSTCRRSRAVCLIVGTKQLGSKAGSLKA